MKLEDEEMLQKIFFSWKGCLDANRIFMIFLWLESFFRETLRFFSWNCLLSVHAQSCITFQSIVVLCTEIIETKVFQPFILTPQEKEIKHGH